MKILGIETSCDETGVALVQNGQIIMAERLSSSIDLQKEYGGVVPELASRVHAEKIIPLIKSTLKDAGVELSAIDGVAVAYGPGLVGALLVGTMTAKTVAMVIGCPLIGVNHLEGHIASVFLDKKTDEVSMTNDQYSSIEGIRNSSFPMLVLIVSGGHTELVVMTDFGVYQTIGETIDDAAGEAFDKAAKILGLDYPGGPSIARAAGEQNTENRIQNTEYRIQNTEYRIQNTEYRIQNIEYRTQNTEYSLPRPMLDSGDFNFSFSGLKTALWYKVKDRKWDSAGQKDEVIRYLAYEFQEAVTDVLVAKTVRAAEEIKPKRVAIVGGVAANQVLRQKMKARFGDYLVVPEFKYCTDNGVKIAVAGYYKYRRGEVSDWRTLGVESNLVLG